MVAEDGIGDTHFRMWIKSGYLTHAIWIGWPYLNLGGCPLLVAKTRACIIIGRWILLAYPRHCCFVLFLRYHLCEYVCAFCLPRHFSVGGLQMRFRPSRGLYHHGLFRYHRVSWGIFVTFSIRDTQLHLEAQAPTFAFCLVYWRHGKLGGHPKSRSLREF